MYWSSISSAAFVTGGEPLDPVKVLLTWPADESPYLSLVGFEDRTDDEGNQTLRLQVEAVGFTYYVDLQPRYNAVQAVIRKGWRVAGDRNVLSLHTDQLTAVLDWAANTLSAVARRNIKKGYAPWNKSSSDLRGCTPPTSP